MENQNKRKKKGKELKAERRKTRRILGKTRDHLDFGAARSLSISRFCALGLCRRRRRRARVFFSHTHTHRNAAVGCRQERGQTQRREREMKERRIKMKRKREAAGRAINIDSIPDESRSYMMLSGQNHQSVYILLAS